MKPALAIPILALLLGGASRPDAQPGGAPAAENCANVTACLERLLTESDSERSYQVMLRLAAIGDDSVVALLGWLGADPRRRDRAEIALAQFERIDARHLPTLIAANGAGHGPLLRAIAAVDSEDAAEFVWVKFLARPGDGPHNQLFQALPRLGDRLRPRLLPVLDSCRTSTNDDLCRGAFMLAGLTRPPYPGWASDAIVAVARSDSASQVARKGAAGALITLRHPLGLQWLMRDLGGLIGAPGDTGLADGATAGTIGEIGRYGPAARDAVPLLTGILGRTDRPDSRVGAARALGEIGDPASAPALIALESAFEDDWQLAYNVMASLGRLRAAEARPLLERAMRGHWHKAVRHNAERALSALAGGQFARAGIAGDTAPFEERAGVAEDYYVGLSGVRFRGDADRPRWCADGFPDGSAAVPQDPVGRISWPNSGSRTLRGRGPAQHVADAWHRQYPDVGRGSVVAVAEADDHLLIGTNAGEFGGGLYRADDRGVRRLFGGAINLAFRMGGRLYVVSGLDHLGWAWGELWVVERGRPLRRIRLPSDPTGFVATAGHVLVIRTRGGDVAVAENGRLLDPGTVGHCQSAAGDLLEQGRP